jgi:flagellar basal body-associated protein FliL
MSRQFTKKESKGYREFVKSVFESDSPDKDQVLEVLKRHPDANLQSEAAREKIATEIVEVIS